MGPLASLRIIEFSGIGPAPFCGMLLADLGADVVRIDKPANKDLLGQEYDILGRGKRSIVLDLKNSRHLNQALQLIDSADGLIEGFRPGVMERLGLGPDVCNSRNPKLVYGRMTGWGQTGPLSQSAGHDINYISLSGALHSIGSRDREPVVPLNLLGDFGGGALYLAVGVLSALLEARESGKGQTVDAAIVDGTNHLMSMMYSLRGNGLWSDLRGDNLLDGSAPFYGVYECSDDKWISIGPIEDRFYAKLLAKIGGDIPHYIVDRHNFTHTDKIKNFFTNKFKQHPQQHWINILENIDVCFAPVLSMEEAPNHPHNIARENFITLDGMIQPAPAPRFSRTKSRIKNSPPKSNTNINDILSAWKTT